MKKMFHAIARDRLRVAVVLVTLSLVVACSDEEPGAPPSDVSSTSPESGHRHLQLAVEGKCSLQPRDENWFMDHGLGVCDWPLGDDAVVWGYVQSAKLVDDIVQGN